MSEIQIHEPDFEQYLRTEDIDYVEVDGELSDMEVYLDLNGNYLQYGPKGVGKTLSFSYYASEHDIPIVNFNCSGDTRESDMVIKPWMEVTPEGEEQGVYIPGAFVLGIMLANEYGSAIVVMEEINALPPNVQKTVNQVGDWRNEITVTEANRVFTLNDDAKLMIGATMNPSSKKHGTYSINDDLWSRFYKKARTYPTGEKLKDILLENGVPESIGHYEGIPQNFISPLMDRLDSVGEAGSIRGSSFSPREAVMFGRAWSKWESALEDDWDGNHVDEALRRALKNSLVDSYTQREDRMVVRDEIESIFGVVVDV